MPLEYRITYHAENVYETPVNEAFWQFLVLPENNASQELLSWSFTNSLHTQYHNSVNGLGFSTIQIRPKKGFQKIQFELKCDILKSEINPFDFIPSEEIEEEYNIISNIDFKAEHEPYLRKTVYTNLPEKHKKLYVFDKSKSVFENLQELNHWVYIHLYFKAGVTDVNTSLEEIIDNRHGVCQDFTHLFCAIAKENGVPSRYTSGYIHQGNNYFGDLQMHAWAETCLPNGLWIGFDPTNDILAAENHIKVAHGKEYGDCAPLKGVVYASGKNETTYTVTVQAAQQQQ